MPGRVWRWRCSSDGMSECNTPRSNDDRRGQDPMWLRVRARYGRVRDVVPGRGRCERWRELPVTFCGRDAGETVGQTDQLRTWTSEAAVSVPPQLALETLPAHFLRPSILLSVGDKDDLVHTQYTPQPRPKPATLSSPHVQHGEASCMFV
jgi:hypothetical protein